MSQAADVHEPGHMPYLTGEQRRHATTLLIRAHGPKVPDEADRLVNGEPLQH
ncbi:hypothetical protein AB0M46_21445 [Dactylosporangium sp. NPDC051485]|uniref:hypothetical protein n=1 Tax=Dactylosporangium sp. NPDC051485 TaxID=3154846 RepID=UPI00342B0FBC